MGFGEVLSLFVTVFRLIWLYVCLLLLVDLVILCGFGLFFCVGLGFCFVYFLVRVLVLLYLVCGGFCYGAFCLCVLLVRFRLCCSVWFMMSVVLLFCFVGFVCFGLVLVCASSGVCGCSVIVFVYLCLGFVWLVL